MKHFPYFNINKENPTRYDRVPLPAQSGTVHNEIRNHSHLKQADNGPRVQSCCCPLAVTSIHHMCGGQGGLKWL